MSDKTPLLRDKAIHFDAENDGFTSSENHPPTERCVVEYPTITCPKCNVSHYSIHEHCCTCTKIVDTFTDKHCYECHTTYPNDPKYKHCCKCRNYVDSDLNVHCDKCHSAYSKHSGIIHCGKCCREHPDRPDITHCCSCKKSWTTDYTHCSTHCLVYLTKTEQCAGCNAVFKCENCSISFPNKLNMSHCCGCKTAYDTTKKLHCRTCHMIYNNTTEHCCKCKIEYNIVKQDHCKECCGTYNIGSKHCCKCRKIVNLGENEKHCCKCSVIYNETENYHCKCCITVPKKWNIKHCCSCKKNYNITTEQHCDKCHIINNNDTMHHCTHQMDDIINQVLSYTQCYHQDTHVLSPCLRKKCSSVTKYLDTINCISESGKKKNIIFKYHGTHKHNILPICCEGFDIRRRGEHGYQQLGVGEYFVDTYDDACKRSGIDGFVILTMIVDFTDNITIQHGDMKYHIVRNTTTKSYCLPVAIIGSNTGIKYCFSSCLKSEYHHHSKNYTRVQFLDDNHRYIDCDGNVSSYILNKYNSRNYNFESVFNSYRYVFDLNEMIQTNLNTGRVRKLKFA